MYKKDLKIRNIFQVDRFAEIYKKYNFIGFLTKLNCMEPHETWVNGFDYFVQKTLGVNYRYPLREISENFENSVREIYLKGKFIIMRNGDSYNLYDLQGRFVFKLRNYTKGQFPQFFYTRMNETDVINILLYKVSKIEFKTIFIVDSEVKEKRTEYLDRKDACEKLFRLKDNEFLQSDERTNFVLTILKANSIEKNKKESEEVYLTVPFIIIMESTMLLIWEVIMLYILRYLRKVKETPGIVIHGCFLKTIHCSTRCNITQS